MKPTRDAFGEELLEIGKKNEKIVALSADVEDSTRIQYFKDEFPERFISKGIAEQDIIGQAVGLSLEGFITFAGSFAVFLTNRAYDTIRVSVCYNNTNVKLVASHCGVTIGEDGATAQCLEDLAIMRVLPNMVVIHPVDAVETKKAVRWMVEYTGPVYLRLGRTGYPIVTKEDDAFEMGKASVLRQGNDVTIIACGVLMAEALSAFDLLASKGISARVLNMHTIKPIDRDAIVSAAKETGAIVTAEEHQIIGGLGSAVAEVLAATNPVPQEFVGVADTFGESGSPAELLEKYHLKDVDIVKAVVAVMERKK